MTSLSSLLRSSFILLPCFFVTSLSAFAQQQQPAPTFTRFIVFGDSLSDNGNLNAAISFDVLKFFGVLDDIDYAQGRFSNGPTFVELLAGNANFAAGQSSQARFYGPLFLFNPATVEGNVNLAIGGATTVGGDLFLNVGIPSVEDQINDFQSAGGRFGTNDLVTLLAGANDIFNADLDAGAAANAATAQSRNVTTLINAGARTILIANLPNLGATPRFNGDATTGAAGLVATNTFNGILATDLQALAAGNPQANLVQADLRGMLDIVIANPEAFGFTNVTQACATPGGGVCANPNEFLFFDDVHPTAAGHLFLAQFVDALLSTDDQAAMTGPLGEMTVSARLEASDVINLPTALQAAINAAIRDPLNGMWLIAIYAGFIFFTDTHLRSWRVLGGVFHATMHLSAAFLMGWLSLLLTVNAFELHYGSTVQLLLSALVTVPLGAVAGSFILGVYLFVSLNVFGRHSNEAFSSLRIQDYKQWLRLKIDAAGKLTIYTIAIDRVPRRWRATQRNGEATFAAHDAQATAPRLIDRIEVRG